MEQRDVEIDLIDLVFYVLSHWRSMIACVLIGAVLGGGFAFVKTNVQVKSFFKQENAYTEEECREKLTETKEKDVRAAVLYNDLMLEYRNDPLMLLDANRVAEGTLLMSFSSSDETRAKGVYSLVDQLLSTKEFYQYIKEKENYPGDVSQILTNRWIDSSDSDLLEAANIIADSSSNKGHVYLYSITAFGESEEFCQNVLADIKDYLNTKTEEIEQVYGNYKVEEVSRYVATIADPAVSEKQVALTESYAEVKKQRDTLVSGFSKVQNAYYSLLIPEEEVEEEESAFVAYLKGIVIGIFVAVMLWGFFLLMRYVFTGKWQAYHTYSGCFGLTDIGVIRRATDKKMNGLDRAFARGRLRGERAMTAQEAVEAYTSAIAIRAAKNELRNIALVGGAADESAQSIVKSLADGIQQKNSSVEVRILHDLPYTASAIDQLQDTDGVVVVETAGVTNRAEMTKELTLLADQKMNILGGITIA